MVTAGYDVRMQFGVRKLLYNRCDPRKPLDPDDDRNVDIDALGTPDHRVRGYRWVDRLAERIELSAEPVLELFTGLPGSGKSTELRRLAVRLAEPGRADMVPVLIDGEDVLDLTARLDVPDILAAIVHACELAVLQVEGLSAEAAQQKALSDGYLTRFWAWLKRTDLELGRGELNVQTAGKLVVELKTRPTLRERVRGTVAANLTSFIAEAHRELTVLEKRAHARQKTGLVVIFDSLEKLRGVTATWHDVLGSAEQVFGGGAPYLKLPVHVVYTIPPALVSRRFERVQFMPMIKLASADGTPFPPGYQAARSLVRRRIPDDNLIELLGPDAEARIRRVILWSGGYPREIVHLLRAILVGGDYPLSDSALERILNEVRDGYRMVVPTEAFPWLARVAVDRYLTLNDDLHRPSADLMLSNNVVLRYLNDEGWFDLHPAVKEIPGIQEAIADYRAEIERRRKERASTFDG